MIAGPTTREDKFRPATSQVLSGLLEGAPPARVPLDWLINKLGTRSFGIMMLLIGLLGLVPGTSPVIGVLLAVVALQMVLARSTPVLPGFIARRSVKTPQLARLVARLIPLLRRLERFVKPRWRTPFEATKRVVGLVILLLGLTLLAPIPFSQIIPAVVIMLLAFAFLEEDGVLLCAALAAAAISLSITAAAVWGAIAGGRYLDRLGH